MRISELGRFYPEGRKTQEQKESPETEKNEVSVTLEQAEKKITTAEVVVGVIALGLRAKLFMDDKGTEARGVIEKAKKDIQTQPDEFKPIFGTTALRLGSLLLDHLRGQKEQKLTIRQGFLDSMQELEVKANQLRMLNDYEQLQQEATNEALRSPVKIAGLDEEAKTKLKGKIRMSNEARNNEAKRKFEEFIDGVLKIK